MVKQTAVRITRDEMEGVLATLIGMPVTKMWRGFGSAIFFELGDLASYQLRPGQMTDSGEITLMIQFCWRVEKARSIWFGSSCTKRMIDARIPRLVGCTIEEAWFEGRLPELRLKLSGGYWFSTHECDRGSTQAWTILTGPRPNRSNSFFSEGTTFKKYVY